MKQSGVKIGTHCSNDYPLLYLAAPGLEFAAHRGYPVKINLSEIEKEMGPRMKTARDNLKAFVDLAGLPWEEPGWTLVSYWG